MEPEGSFGAAGGRAGQEETQMPKLRKMLGAAGWPSVTRMMQLIETQNKRTLAGWAADFAGRYLPLTAAEARPALTAALDGCRRFAGGDFPENYYCQCVTYLAVTGYRRWYLAVLILGKGFQIYQMTTVPGDDMPEWCESSLYVGPEEIAALTAAAEQFWSDYVERDDPPPVHGERATTEALETIYAEDNGGEVQLLGREDLFREYFDLKYAADRIAREMDAIKQTIMEDLGQAASGSCGGFSVTWKNQTRMLFDAKRFARDHPGMDLSGYYKASVSRPFKITKEDAGK